MSARACAVVAVVAWGGAGTAGCIPLPFALPPTTASVEAGAAIGKVVPPEEGGSGQTEATFALQGRAAMAPLGLVPELGDRRFDFQLGYVIEGFPKDEVERYVKHGGFVRGTFFPWVGEQGMSGFRARFGISPIAEVLYEPARDEVGGGGSIAAQLELMKHAEGGYAGFDGRGVGVLGGSYGEWGIGLGTTVGVRGVGTTRYWMATGGLTIRFPAVAGLLLIPVWELAK